MEISTADGRRLRAKHLPAKGRPVGVAVCGHAMFCNAKTLDRPRGGGLGSVLAGAGFETLLLDFRGHGNSRIRLSPERDTTYDDYVLQDIPAAVHAAAARWPDLPVALVGHSLGAHGGAAALAVDRTLPVRALVSLAGNVWIPTLEPHPASWWFKRATFEAWAAVSRAYGRFPARHFRQGTDDEALGYVMQLTRNARRDRWASADGRYDYLRLLAHVRTPILSVVGTGDTWMCRPDCARRWLSHATRARVEHRVVGAREGDPRGVDHMGIVLDERMRSVWHEIADWLKDGLTS